MALDVLRQRLAGKAYAEAVAYTAQEFGCAQSAISAAWEVHNLEAFDALIDEMVKSGWEFTDDVRNLLKDIFPNGITVSGRGNNGTKRSKRLGEVIAKLRKNAILDQGASARSSGRTICSGSQVQL